MRHSSDFAWPPLTPGGPTPLWDGRCFRVGEERHSILEYSRNEAAWDAALTGFHEQVADVDHPIDVASRRGALSALKSRLVAPSPVVLEVGSSSGHLLPQLRLAFPNALVIGSDAFPDALMTFAARHPGFPLLQFDLTRCPVPDASIDVVVALNVLEHIRDDRLALAQIRRLLKPGGFAYLEVPAGPRLYDVYDEMLHHYRRYDADGLTRLAADAGLEMEWSSHLGCLVFPLFAIAKVRNRRLLWGTDEAKVRRVTENITASRGSRALAWALAAEQRLGRHVRLPFGIRFVGVLRKAV